MAALYLVLPHLGKRKWTLIVTQGLSIQGSTNDNIKGGPSNLGLYEDNKMTCECLESQEVAHRCIVPVHIQSTDKDTDHVMSVSRSPTLRN